MLISDDPNYVLVLKKIAKVIMENQLDVILSGREGIIKQYLSSLQEVRPVGPLSQEIFTKDLNHIIDKVMGCEF